VLSGKPVPSTQTFIVEGAVPYLGDLLIHVALLVEVQFRVPPPVLAILTEEPVRHPRTL
jgi:hypothetical protein